MTNEWNTCNSILFIKTFYCASIALDSLYYHFAGYMVAIRAQNKPLLRIFNANFTVEWKAKVATQNVTETFISELFV